MTDLRGQIIHGYELQDKIGEGGFGAVYRAFQPVIERDVAIKVILAKYANQPDFIRNFETEAQIVARLEHPYVVPLYDYWRDPDGAFLVMRWFRGNLRQVLTEKGALPPVTVLHLLEQIASALHAAHHKQIIHRDLKPDNILLDDEGNAYLTDFGIARISGQEPSTQSISGTIAYTSPEQLQSFAPSPQMDIYSLGIVLFEMLAGQHPYRHLSPLEIIYHHMQHPLPDIRQLNPEIPLELNTVLQKATAKDLRERYATMLDLLNAFRAVAADGVVSKPVQVWDELQVNPYKGLRAFDVADAADFYGREHLVHTLVERLRSGERFLAVVGPSGSGKSSVVKAGLIAALRGAVIADAHNWFIADFVPGTNPIYNLAQALSSISPLTLTNAEEQLISSERGLIWLVDIILAGTTGEITLVIDQFEEVFILAQELERKQLLELLTTAINDTSCRLRVILSLRADFYDRPLLYEGFSQLVQDHTQVVLPLSAEELESAITSPAKRVGLHVETDLIAAIVSDVREEPGALPLLQYTLTELFEKRANQKMTLAAYRASGGVSGALAQRADEVYETLSDTQKAIAQQVFLRLVTLGEGMEDTRRRVRHAELQQIIHDKSDLNAVLDAFGTARLLTFDVESRTREPLIEVAHEAFIREWRQLREWLTDSRNDIRLQRLLATATAEWHESNEDGSYLLRGSRLAQFEEWAQGSSVLLAPAEKNFLEKSIEAQEAEFDARERAQLERQRLQVQIQARQQQVIFALGFGVVLAIILTVFAFLQANIARSEANANATAQVNAVAAQATSERRAAYANAQQQALRAEQLDEAGQADIAIALAVEANRLHNPPPDAIRILSNLSNYPLIQHYLGGHNEPTQAMAFTPDGRYLLSGTCGRRRGSRCSGAELILWDVATGTVIRRLTGHRNAVTAVAIAADGRLALSGASDGTIILWDITTGEQLRVYDGASISQTPLQIRFSPDGSHFGVVSVRDLFAVREVETGAFTNIAAGNDEELIVSFAFSSDGTRVVLSACQPDRDEVDTVISKCEDGSEAAIILLDAMTGEIINRTQVVSIYYVSDLRFAHDDSLIVGTSEYKVSKWDANTLELLHQYEVLFQQENVPTRVTLDTQVTVAADGNTILAIDRTGIIVQIDLHTFAPIRTFIRSDITVEVNVVASDTTGQLVALALPDNRIMLVEFNSPDQLYDWVLSNRVLRFFPCNQRLIYNVEPLCDAEGNIPPTSTPYPTITPFPTATIPVWTPIPSPTATE